MHKNDSIGLMALLSVLLGVTGCVGQTPASAPGSAPVANAAPSTRHIFALPAGAKSFSSIVNSLPKRISRADAGSMMRKIDPRRVTPMAGRGRVGNFGRGPGAAFGGRYGFGQLGDNAYGVSPYNNFNGVGGAFADGANINGDFPGAFADQMGDLSYLSCGNLQFPYQAVGASALEPYVVDHDTIPFFVERTRVAHPVVTHIAHEVPVPRTVIVDHPVTVPQVVPTVRTEIATTVVPEEKVIMVPTTVTVPRPVDVPVQVPDTAVVPLHTSVPVPTTVVDKGVVMEDRVDATYSETSAIVGPGTDLVPMTFNPGAY